MNSDALINHTTVMPEEIDNARDQILSEMKFSYESLKHDLAAGNRGPNKIDGTYSQWYLEKLVILRMILDLQDPRLVPELDPKAPKGHTHSLINQGLMLPPGEDINILEDLADLGLLKRELYNHINLCPGCHHCQVNYREVCPGCGSIDIDVESMIHHFRCAYSGLESEFTSGIDLICPKCRKQLHQLGQDFDRPHETYICHQCDHLFEEPIIKGQCLNCALEYPGHEGEVAKIYNYRPTLLTVRAVELNRLTGLDVSEIMMDSHVRLATREFLNVETEREIYRVNRYGMAFSTVRLNFELHDQPYAIFREWRPKALRQLGELLVASHRDLDLLARIDHSRIGLLLPHTDEPGLAAVRKRIMNQLVDMSLMSSCGNILIPRWIDATWMGPSLKKEDVLAFYDQQDESA